MRFRRLACSFCGRGEREVAKLVAGPHVFICDRCAYETVRIMESASPTDVPPVTHASLRKRLRECFRRAMNWFQLAAVAPRPDAEVITTTLQN
jgi:hypothetical protein